MHYIFYLKTIYNEVSDHKTYLLRTQNPGFGTLLPNAAIAFAEIPWTFASASTKLILYDLEA